MLQIVSNSISGVDVDKWDYFARDCHHLGISNSFDHNRFMSLIKVLKAPPPPDGDGKYHLCVRDKVKYTVLDKLLALFVFLSKFDQQDYINSFKMVYD